MHDTAYELGSLFFGVYLSNEAAFVLDVGSQDINGTLRGACPYGCVYIGVDLSPGPGVDLVLKDPYTFPLRSNSFDVVVSTSCFEHDQFFWLTFMEMIRVTKPGGFIYINSPSNGDYHGYPFDHWRFYPDAGLALEAWSKHQNNEVTLVESFMAYRKDDIWNDCVMVFCKGDFDNVKVKNFISSNYHCYNLRRYSEEGLSNFLHSGEAPLLPANARQGGRLDGGSTFPVEGTPPDAVPAEVGFRAILDSGQERVIAIKQKLTIFEDNINNLQKRVAHLQGRNNG